MSNKYDEDSRLRSRNLVHFVQEDAEAVLDRPITDDEYHRIVKTLEWSLIGEVFEDAVRSAVEP